MKAGKNVAFVAIAVLFAALGVLIGHWQTSPDASEPAAVDQLFAGALPDPQGREQPLAQWKGKPLVVNFWATWCAPCVEEMPELQELHAELSTKGMQVIGIGIDTAENIAAFGSKLGIDYPLLVGGPAATEMTRRFGNKAGGLPYTVLIDAGGQVRKTYLGRLKMEELRRDLADL